MKIKKIIIALILLSFISLCYADSNDSKSSNKETTSEAGKILTFNLGNGITFDMVYCPAGEFVMGCNDEEYINEYFLKYSVNPQYVELHKERFGFEYNEKPHNVTISKPFYIGKYEVTQKIYEYTMGKEMKEKANPSYFKGLDKPVTNISYDDLIIGVIPPASSTSFWNKARENKDLDISFSWAPAQKKPKERISFLKKINKMLENQLPRGYKFDLPTEAQWEYACKAGINKNFINNLNEIGWYTENSAEGIRDSHGEIFVLGNLREVGKKKPNAWGIYDMLGNAREWCKDKYGDYPSEAVIDPAGNNIAIPVIRGGNFEDQASHCRSTARYWVYHSSRQDYCTGFRLALVPVE